MIKGRLLDDVMFCIVDLIFFFCIVGILNFFFVCLLLLFNDLFYIFIIDEED